MGDDRRGTPASEGASAGLSCAPAAGTGGFLTETFEHLRQQAKTIEQRYILQKRSLSGGEAKPLPYLLAQMNLLFFDRSGPTREIWYYEQPLPDGRKNYTKTQPIQFEEFGDCLKWWKQREENERAWKVPATDILANGCNLDIKNPISKQDLEHMPPDQLADSILRKEQRIAELMAEIKVVLMEGTR